MCHLFVLLGTRATKAQAAFGIHAYECRFSEVLVFASLCTFEVMYVLYSTVQYTSTWLSSRKYVKPTGAYKRELIGCVLVPFWRLHEPVSYMSETSLERSETRSGWLFPKPRGPSSSGSPLIWAARTIRLANGNPEHAKQLPSS